MTRALLALLLLAACDGAAPLDAGLDGGPEPDGGPANGPITCEVVDDAGTVIPVCPDGRAALCHTGGNLEYETRRGAGGEELCVRRAENPTCGGDGWTGWVCPAEAPVAGCFDLGDVEPRPGPCPGD